MSSAITCVRKSSAGTIASLFDRLQTLIHTPDLDPVTFLNFDREEPYSGAGWPLTGWTAR